MGRTLQLGVPGRQEPLRAKLDETHNTGSTAVWSGPVEGGSDADTLTVVKGQLETHITLATPTRPCPSWWTTPPRHPGDRPERAADARHAGPDRHPDAKQLPLPPPAQG